MKNKLAITPYVNIRLLKRLAAGILLITLTMTLPLWITTESLPPLPIWNGVAGRRLIHWIGFGALVGWIFIILIYPKGTGQGIIALILIAQLVLLDFNRCQVWMLHYVYIFLLPEELDDSEAMLSVLLLLSLTYVFSGVHKINEGFAKETLAWLTTPFGFNNTGLRWIVPSIEALLGIGLLAPKVSRWASVVAMMMHVTIIYVLVYYGWNYSVIPWNVLLMVIHLANVSFGGVSYQWVVPRSWPMMTAIVLLTLLSYTGVIHRSFSFPLYSGDQYTGIVVFSDATFKRLPLPVQSMCGKLHRTGEPFLNLDRYALEQLGVPLFQDIRSYQWAAKQFVVYARDEDDLALLIRNGTDFVFDKDLWAFTLTELNALSIQ